MAIRILVPQIALLVVVVFASVNISGLVSDYSSAINEIGKIRGGIQRYVKAHILGYADQFPLGDISVRIDKALLFERANRMLFSDRDIGKIEELEKILDDIEKALSVKNRDPELIFSLSELAWTTADSIAHTVESKTHGFLRIYTLISYGVISAIGLLVIVLYILKYRIQKGVEVRAAIDKLTGLYNRNYLDEFFSAMSKRNDDSKICILMCDIDHFKIVNDTYGHAAGDLVLQRIGQLLLSTCRSEDRVFRYGGEEFLILSSFDDGVKLSLFADRLRRAVESAEIIERPVTVSIGVATRTKSEDLESVIFKADRALYRAKQEGRNRVAFAERPVESE